MFNLRMMDLLIVVMYGRIGHPVNPAIYDGL
jgi:hypothetical protein